MDAVPINRDHEDPDIAAKPEILYGLGGVHIDFDGAWFFGPYGWIFDNPVAIPRPVPCRGRQGLWTLPDDVAREVSAQVEEVRCAG